MIKFSLLAMQTHHHWDDDWDGDWGWHRHHRHHHHRHHRWHRWHNWDVQS